MNLLRTAACLLLQFAIAHAASCYQCASDQLNPWEGTDKLWQLTGLPVPFPKSTDGTTSLYNSAFCDKPESSDAALQTKYKVDCSSLCMTYAVTNPNVLTLDANTKPLIVRGCWDKLINQPSLATQQNVFTPFKDRCESGKYRTWRNDGTTTQTTLTDAWAYNKFCPVQESPCNNYQLPKTLDDSSCTISVTPPSPFECYQCQSADSNCFSTTCSGDARQKWCSKTATRVNGKWQYSKTCSPVNPYGQSNGCGEYDTIMPFPTRAKIEIANVACFCNDKTKCNSATSTQAMFGIVSVIASYILTKAIL